MSLRARLVLSITAIVMVVIVLLSTGVQLTVSRQLRNEIDRTLDARVVLIGDVLRENRPNDRPGRRQRNPLDELLPTRFDTITQIIDKNGGIVIGIGDIDLPVNENDLAIASGSAQNLHRVSIEIDKVDYRVLTVPIRGGGALQLAKEMSEIENASRNILRWIIALGALSVVVAAITGLILARRIAKPITELADAAEKIAVTRDVKSPLEVQGVAEVANLAKSFNTMLHALGESMTQQQQFVQDAGHELRTPLTSLRANTELLERGELDAEVRGSILRDMRTEVDELAKLSVELSSLANDQRFEEVLEPLDLEIVARDIATRAQRRANRDVNVVVKNPATVSLRPTQFERALSNLIDNALKFDQSTQPIEVLIDNKRVSVVDHGPGVSDVDKSQIFNRFYRATATRSMPGSGLGLAIVAQFAQDHDAKTFVSDTPGGGATVGFEFQ